MIDKITRDFIDKIVIEFKKDDNRRKVKKDILNPILDEFTEKIYPYINMLFIMYSINIILIILILILTVFKKR
jgi:hypothetical protein